jgi:hypothetical protein
MRARILVAAIVVLWPIFSAAQAVSPPPKPLHFIDGHWTPYDPPSGFPEGSTVHVVVPGDTLWDLARTYLGDPYLWPQIWERNPYILDSHWIYPGDPILIDVAVQPPPEPEAEVVEEGTEMSELPPGGPGREEVPMEMPEPLGNSADVYCFARLYPDESEFPFSVVSAERVEYQDHFSEGDVVYIDGGVEQGVSAGDRFFIYHRDRQLVHPVSASDMGIIFRQIGQLRVLCAQEDSSIAEVTYACDPVSLGDLLQPFAPVPVPLVIMPDPTDRCDAPNGKPTGYVVYTKDDVISVGAENLVMIDLGAAEGLYPGTFATVFRDNPVEGMPRLVVGELGVLTVEDGHATAKITRGWAPVHVGDRIELK